MDSLTDSEKIIHDAASICIIEQAGSYFGIARVKEDNTHEKLFPSPNITIESLEQTYAHNHHIPVDALGFNHVRSVDLTGSTVAHVMSVTKSVTGFMWAYYIPKKKKPTEESTYDGPYPRLRDFLLSNGADSQLGTYLDERRAVIHSIDQLRKAKVKELLTHTSGIVLKDTGFHEMVVVNMCIYKTEEEGRAPIHYIQLYSVERLVLETMFVGVNHHGEFHYDNLLSQLVIVALENMEQARRKDPTFLLKNDIIANFFPPVCKSVNWPIVDAGFTNRTGKKMFNTLGFCGLQMTGEQLLQYGIFLMTNHRNVLERIHGDDDFYVTLASGDKDAGMDKCARRAGWRYSFLWWLPRFSFDKSTEKYKIVAAIGYQGQYLLMELTTGYVFVRQYFQINLTENVDLSHITPAKSEFIRDPCFVYRCIQTIQALEKKN